MMNGDSVFVYCLNLHCIQRITANSMLQNSDIPCQVDNIIFTQLSAGNSCRQVGRSRLTLYIFIININVY